MQHPTPHKSIPASQAAIAAAGAIAGMIAQWYRDGGPLFQYLLLAAAAMLFLDTALGITSALAVRKEKLMSVKLRRLPLKIIQYSALILFAHMIDALYQTSGGHKEKIYIIQIAALFSIVLHEATSVLENLKDLEPITGFKVPGFIGSKLDQLAKAIGTEPVIEVETTTTERVTTRIVNDPKKPVAIVPKSNNPGNEPEPELPQEVVMEGVVSGTMVGVVKPVDDHAGGISVERISSEHSEETTR